MLFFTIINNDYIVEFLVNLTATFLTLKMQSNS